MSIARQFSAGVAWMAAGNWAEQAINFALFVVLARLLGADAFGLMAMAAAFVVLSEFLVRESLSEVLISAEAPPPSLFDAAFWALLALGAGLCALLFLAAPWIAGLYDQPLVAPLIRVLSLSVALIALTAVPVACLRREMRFRVLSLRAVAGVAAGGAVGIGMAFAGYGVWSLAGQRLVQVAVNVAMAWGAVAWRPGLRARRADFRQVLGFGSQVLGLRAAELAATQVPVVVIGAVLGPGPLGLYALAWRLVELTSFLIVTPLRMASQPAFAAMTRSGGGAADLLLTIARISGLVAFPLFFGMAALASPLVAVVFGPGWQGAAAPLAVLSLVGLYFCIEKVNQSFCLAAGRAGALTRIAWAEVATGAAAIWVASPHGLVAVAAAFAGTYAVWWILRLRLVAAIGAISPGRLVSCHLMPGAAAALMAAVLLAQSLWLQHTALVELLAGVAAGVVVFATLTFATMRDRLGLIVTTFRRRGPGGLT